MIAIYTDMMYGFSEKIEDLISLDEITKHTEILMIDYELLIELDLITVKKNNHMKIVVLSEEYNHDEALSVYEQNIEHYVVVKSGDDIDLLYKMFKNTSNRIDEIEINKENKTIIVNDEVIKLTSKEIAIYEYLRQNRGEVCLRQDILVDVLKYHRDADTRLIDVYVKYLRTKLGTEGKKIKTIRGKGYLYE